jgi:hypothetical protein
MEVGKYCEYEKTFIIKQMELTTSAPVAASLWIATIIFTLLIVVGLCCLFTYSCHNIAFKRRKKGKFGNWNFTLKKKRGQLFQAVPKGTVLTDFQLHVSNLMSNIMI